MRKAHRPRQITTPNPNAMKKLFFSSAIVLTVAGAVLLANGSLTAQAQVAQPPAQNAQELKENAQVQAPDAPAVPPELQKLVTDFLYAFGKGDEAAMAACWHSSNAVPMTQSRQVPPGAVSVPTTNEDSATKEQILRLRTICARLFGSPEQLKLLRVDFGRTDRDGVGPTTTHDDVQIHLMASDLHIVLSIDDVEKLAGGWKFKGRMSDEVTILVPPAQ